ncbi:MAG: phenylalanine--tRNA ligase subunit alpha [Bdellovibrionales bacterium]|jgi:phenylalanyl-tRNA synthetase alpha chain|nr:phenylalanine--tRNA ligase subunit alpha [Bdellovibrionales bacterium]
MSNLDALKQEIVQTVKAANDIQSLEEVRVTALGKKGRVTDLMKTLGGLSPDERKEMGQALNRLKDEITAEIDARATTLKAAALNARLSAEKIAVTLTPRPETKGSIHPISQTIEEMITIFADMGFSVAEGPEIEDDFHNFTALNFPPEHPARQMHDTFYLPDVDGKTGDAAKRLLRTHTSTVQVHVMQTQKPPIRVIIPGRTFRSDYDMTHTPMFHQMEGLLIDKAAHMGHLKGCLIEFCKRFFEVDELPTRFRPSFFPFTEPSAEMDIGCSREKGELKIGAGSSWLEILGCGMVHPNVLKNCGIDPEEYQGFAFGMGIERVAMLKYGIPDLRTFFESDLRWLRHYGFGPLEQPNKALG